MSVGRIGALRAPWGWIDRHASPIFGVFALIAFVGLLYLGRKGTFFQDEWAFIQIGGLGTVRDWFAPHNEHWSTVPFALYRALLLTAGLRSYLPYLALLLTLHVVASSAIFVLLRRPSGSFVALLGSGLFLVLGSGYQNLFWAFQIGFVGSTAAGLWALVALGRDRPRLAALLLLIAVASSSMGLPFLVAGGVELLLDRRRRGQIGWLAAVAAAYVVWFVAIGHEGLAGDTSNFGLANILGLPRFAAVGIADAIGATFGLGTAVGTGFVIVVLAAGVRLRPLGQLPIRAAALAVGLVTLFLLIGLGRAQLGDAQAHRSRYLYEAAAFLLVGLAAVGGRIADPSGDPVETEAPRRRRPAVDSIAVGVLIVALVAGVANVRQLFGGARFFTEAAGELRATIALMDRYGDTLAYDPPPSTRWSVPSPALLARAIAEWGTPARDVLLATVVRSPTALERDRALWRVVGDVTRPRQIERPLGAPSADVVADRSAVLPATPGRPPTAVASTGATVVRTGDCIVLGATDVAATTGMNVVIAMDDGASVGVMTIGGGTGAVRLARDAPPDPLDEATVAYVDRSWAAVGVPRLGDGSSFTLQLSFPARVGAAVVCAA